MRLFFDFFQRILTGEQFLISASYLIYTVTVFNFFDLFIYAVTVSKKNPNYLVMKLQFFSGINSA